MVDLSMESLPLGFRFRPTDEELVNHYLRLKINGRDSEVQVIPEIDVCRREPWDLPGLSVIKTNDPEWFFFCPRDRKYPNGHRSNRATDCGYWKATGKDRTIKSKKSLIGMKKTLVFYKGRAPKGRRTTWIMHEYRATSKDLDGTAPGQGAFVLCRLFHKLDEKVDAGKHEEMDRIGYSPIANKLSPDETSSDLVQETPTPEMEAQKQSEGIKGWLMDKSDDVSPNGQVIGGSCCNSHMTSDLEDHGVEDNAIEGFPRVEGNLNCYDPLYDQIDCKIFSPVQSLNHEDLAPYLESFYASDFGNDQSGMHFQDGTAEQDVSLSDLLEEVFNNHEESCEESTYQKNSVAVSEVYMAENACTPLTLRAESSQGQYDTEVEASGWLNGQLARSESLQIPASFVSDHAQSAIYDQEVKSGYVGDLGNYPIGQDALSTESAADSFYGTVHNWEEPTSLKNPVNNSGDLVGGTGIKIRTRRPQQQPNSVNFVTQGIAPRRIRLQMKLSVGSFDIEKETNASLDEEVQSAPTMAAEEVEDTLKPQKEDQLLKLAESEGIGEESSIKLRRRVKSDGEPNSPVVGQAAVHSEAAPLHHGPRLSFSIMLSIFIIVILLVFSLGTWRCLSSRHWMNQAIGLL